MRIFDACGFETEISNKHGAIFWDPDANAGLESLPLSAENQPYVLKSPWSYQFIEEILQRPEIKLDAVLIPIRNLADATASRVVLELQHRYKHGSPDLLLETPWADWGVAPGGMVHSLEPLDQARVLAHSFYKLIEPLARNEVPIKFLAFPRFVSEPEYLYRALGDIIQTKISLDEFLGRVQPVLDSKLVRIGTEGGDKLHSAFSASADLPDFATLDRMALKREVQRLGIKLAEMTQMCKGLSEECERLRGESNLRRTATSTARRAKAYVSNRVFSRLRLRSS
ncbi:hypothetical protein [Hyphomicrobium sp. MC1]|uniref:hypothetical protein n=1 Tax=Hyphomicrobium sp. (strain MC1) TaxID=717785 RepID=UPI0012F48155|nr:hypothetical protein [Hyphomicrobium sp. MC1]